MDANFACRLCGFCYGLEGIDTATMEMAWGLMETHLNTHSADQLELFIQCNGVYEPVGEEGDEDPSGGGEA